AQQRQTFNHIPEVQGEVETRFVYFPLNANDVRPAFETMISAAKSSDIYQVTIDAVTGALLALQDTTVYDGTLPATFRVFTSDSPAPRTPGPNTPDGTQAPLVSRDLLTFV